MPVLPQHAVDVATFEETSMTAPIGSGPYRVTAVKPGASVTLTRNPDYWGRDLPVNRGLWNFDEIRLDFYREANGDVRSIQARTLRFSYRNRTAALARRLRFPCRPQWRGNPREHQDRHAAALGIPGVQYPASDVFRIFVSAGALTLLFDFEWINRNYFFGLYGRAPQLLRRLGAIGLRPAR